ncbi:MAG: sacsin N-terminal ATP-binding-like domain-containing protein [Desulfococcaceae bacterium]
MADLKDFRNQYNKKLELVRKMPSVKALIQLKELRETDWDNEDYRNSLKIMMETLYEDRKHFILELIQNADDAQYIDGRQASLKFIIHDDSIELLYNEKGFDIENVIAVTGTGRSTKIYDKNSAHSFIGEKGIGFKSVFALASDIEIESPPWHFMLERKEPVIPKPLKNGKFKQGDGTRLKIRFSNPADIDEISSVIKGFADDNKIETILFLQRLSEFIIEDHRETTVIKEGIFLTPANRASNSLTIRFHNSDKSFEYVLYSEDFEFPAELAKKRWERLTGDEPVKRRISVAGRINKPENGGTYKGRLFCYLPTKIELPIPLFLQIDGHTKADRERLFEPDKNWNQYLLNLLPQFLTNAILKWREHPVISKQLPDYIPTETNMDQLSDVFSKFIDLLKKTCWIRTFDDKWEKPEKTLIADKFWKKWFTTDEKFRKRVENALGKKFVHSDWVEHWHETLKYYKIAILSKAQIASVILPNIALPETLLNNDDNLTELYQEFLNWDNYSFNLYRSDLLKSPIYPFENRKKDRISQNGTENVFWLSVKSKRSTGLENLIEYRIINQDYTYSPKASSNASQEQLSKIEEKEKRNKTVQDLLKKLNIDELDEDKIQKLQIDWLCRFDWKNGTDDKKPYEIFSAIFKSFNAKHSSYDENYLQQIKKLSSAKFPSENNTLTEIRNLILPSSLRLKSADKIFECTGLESIKIPSEFFDPPETKAKKIDFDKERERKQKLLENWRQFLIHCGVYNKFRFIINKTNKYSNMFDFENRDKRRHDLLIKEINDYTWYNPIDLLQKSILIQ